MAFRMSKTDLQIQSIYHHLQRRIEAHICISFTAYSIYKELGMILLKEKTNISVEKAKNLHKICMKFIYITGIKA